MLVEPLARRARRDLERLGLADRFRFRIGDGHAGWPEAAPFDAIVVTAPPPEVPAPLREQLAIGGRLVIPVGVGDQALGSSSAPATASSSTRRSPSASFR